MVWLMLVVVLTVADAKNANRGTSKVQTLEKQVEILTNLVNAQSSIINKISCIQSSNPISECNLKIADQAKKIVKIDGDLASLHSLVKTKGKVIQQLQSTVTDLSKKLKKQEKNLTSLDSKHAADVSSLHSTVQSVEQKTKTLTNSVNQLTTKVQQGQWPSGHYCILASGSCPTGFSRRSGYMKAIRLYKGTGFYINRGHLVIVRYNVTETVVMVIGLVNYTSMLAVNKRRQLGIHTVDKL